MGGSGEEIDGYDAVGRRGEGDGFAATAVAKERRERDRGGARGEAERDGAGGSGVPRTTDVVQGWREEGAV